MLIEEFNALPTEEAERDLQSTFASRKWAVQVARGRPYANFRALFDACESAWSELAPDDWLAAFAAHPRIGEKGGHAPQSSDREQSLLRGAPAGTMSALAEHNRRYEARFGHVFLIFASGRTAEEILTSLRERMHNDPAKELGVAADEHRKITRLRLGRMLSVMTISTHVLDTARGRPAAGVAVTFSHRNPGSGWSTIGRAVTNEDGRAEVSRSPVQGGEYRLEFASGDYFNATGTNGFYPEVSVVFVAADGDAHLHVPLLLSPFGYSTYKGT